MRQVKLLNKFNMILPLFIICKQEIIRTYSKSPIFAKLCLNES